LITYEKLAELLPSPSNKMIPNRLAMPLGAISHFEPDGVINELVCLPVDGSADPWIVAGGHDFYSFPRPSPDGRQLAWTTWDHPRMPWDGTDLWVADCHPDGRLALPKHVAGGPGESIFQPEWGPGGELFYVSDRSGWWNLY
jgi:hypothetical protein